MFIINCDDFVPVLSCWHMYDTTLCRVLWSLLVLLCLAYIRGGISWPTYIRCSDVPVSVESGRYTGIPHQELLCLQRHPSGFDWRRGIKTPSRAEKSNGQYDIISPVWKTTSTSLWSSPHPKRGTKNEQYRPSPLTREGFCTCFHTSGGSYMGSSWHCGRPAMDHCYLQKVQAQSESFVL